MNQNRKRKSDMPNRASNMEPAEGSRETVRGSGRDLGSSSDRAMFDERVSKDRRGSGGISNRPLDEEQSEQDHLPERGSER